MFTTSDTICAISTPAGVGAIAIIRLSGKNALPIANRFFETRKKEKKLVQAESNKVYFGNFVVGEEVVDEVFATCFKTPHTYTGEDMVEFSCHGSQYIQQRILEAFIDAGARLANPGEFTMRAFLNGKLDLLQAEAVADVIASHSKASNELALSQLRGGFSKKIAELRERFVEFAALIELELDFSEEDVEFADRKKLMDLLQEIENELKLLMDSFSLGNVIKQGVPVAIIGKPNVGKSTLLNALLNEERAIVSDIPGTTRDTIEDMLNIQGTTFRFIDTAGIRNSDDTIENFGIERTYKAVENAQIILYLVDISATTIDEIEKELNEIGKKIDLSSKKVILIANKTDKLSEMPAHFQKWNQYETIYISAKRNENINLITDVLSKSVDIHNTGKTLVSNVRHYEAMKRTLEAINDIKIGMESQISGDLISIDIKNALKSLGEITGGTISSDEVLGAIFGRFCIGK
ncbi:tRNA uridine-5-carboxymethylaminomethyl(34) synthesis GTPase MnmE [Bacteroidales bacterium OttesenSCG-928-C19]|nr:tRNA uridine-5-carboxymethylaminomethyl(34) synthesis GTPase MnmE [Bacteroidales bacterium OttesenSCG-928-C19]